VLRTAVAFIGAQIIYALIWLFGKRVALKEAPWLCGPCGGPQIGATPYEDLARAENLALEHRATEGGLVADFSGLLGPEFDPARVHALVRDFYEHTARYRMDVWSKTWFPMNIGLWLLVTTISRKVNQLNFPMGAFDAARGMTSEIVLLRDGDGKVRYTGWFRKLKETDRVIYTGFYMVEKVPGHGSPCIKVVFPMPRGNATVILRPAIDDNGRFFLHSDGRRFGEPGFYRIQGTGDRPRVWYTKSLKERFCLYVDDDGVLRCDHDVRFLGLPVLALHYRIAPLADA
jgi:hypothetical protein